MYFAIGILLAFSETTSSSRRRRARTFQESRRSHCADALREEAHGGRLFSAVLVQRSLEHRDELQVLLLLPDRFEDGGGHQRAVRRHPDLADARTGDHTAFDELAPLLRELLPLDGGDGRGGEEAAGGEEGGDEAACHRDGRARSTLTASAISRPSVPSERFIAATRAGCPDSPVASRTAERRSTSSFRSG